MNIWCAGNSLLSDGQVLVTGGNLKYLVDGQNSYEGLNHVYTFDPFSETWTRQPNMNHGRWYPSQLLMPDGRTFIMGGLDESGTLPTPNKNEDLELFNPPAQRGGQGSISFLGPEGVLDDPGMPTRGDYYPHLFWMPNGRGLVAGPYTNDSWWFDAPANPAAFGPSSWTDVPNFSRSRVWGTAVLVPGGPDGAHQVVQLGGSDLPANNPTAVASAEVFDTATGQWTVHNQGDTFALNERRSHANTVLLPDGSMVEVGGGLGSATPTDPGTNGAPGQWAAEDAQKQVELWDPANEEVDASGRRSASSAPITRRPSCSPTGASCPPATTTTGSFARRHRATSRMTPPRSTSRRTSSTATRSRHGQRSRRPRSEILRARRSTSATDPSSRPPTKAVLMGPGAATHAVDMNQRYVPLEVTGQGVRAPERQGAAVTTTSRSPATTCSSCSTPAGTPSGRRAGPRRRRAAAGTTSGPPPSPRPPRAPAGGTPPAATPPAAKATKPKVRVRLVRRSGKRLVRVTVARWTKKRVRLRIVLRDRRKHTVRRFTATVRTGRTTTLKARVPARARSVAASVR